MTTADGCFLDVVVPGLLDGERVDRVVSMLAPCSRSDAARVIAAGDVSLDGRVLTRASHRVPGGAHLLVREDPVVSDEELTGDSTVGFEVLHVDDDVIVVDKPAGLVCHPGPGHRGSTLVHGLVARFPDLDPATGVVVGSPERPGLVHRLDRGTSGLLVVARNPDAYGSLVEQLQAHTVERVYTALVRGHPSHHHGVIDAPVGRSRRDPLRMAVTAEGREARTAFAVEHLFDTDDHDRAAALALLTCRLETGRTHQIRVHLASVGRPVVGDRLYGGPDRRPHLSRPFLHARRLSFRHPGSGATVTFDSPLPQDLVALLDTLRPRLERHVLDREGDHT